MEQIQAIRFDVQQVGKHVKGSKKRYTWEIALKDKHHTIVLDFSFISGKVKITVDRKILLQNELPANVSFQYPFTLDGFALNIIQQGETFQLRLNNKVFSHLYTQQKTNTEFKKYEEQVKDIKVNLAQLNPQNKKISLNIGALGPQKKKKQATGQSAGWDAFSGGSFPNYFGQSPQKIQQKPQAPQPKIDLLGQEQKTEASSVQSNLLAGVNLPKNEESFFEFAPQPQQTNKNSSQQFGNVQQMFGGLNLKGQTNNEIDFFADQPKKQSSTKQNVPQQQSSDIGSFSFDQFSGSNNAFATGVKFDPLKVNPKQFSTSIGNKPMDIDFFNAKTTKQQINLGGFTKKTTPQASSSPTQLQSVVSGQDLNNQNLQAKSNVGLTDISINDFMVHKSAQNPTNIDNALDFSLSSVQNQQFAATKSSLQQNPQASDFSTMQLLFQTNSVGQNNFGGLNQNPSFYLSPQPQVNAGLNFNNFSTNPQPGNDAQFNTMKNLFQTTNYENLNANRSVTNEPKPLPDFLKNNKPDAFVTMGSGGINGGFNMASFGTMQASNPQKTTNLDLNFFEKKPNNLTSNGAGNLI